MKLLTVQGFRGMNNKIASRNRWTDRDGFLEPEIVVNADVMNDGTLSKRSGFARQLYIRNAHSLWAGTKMFFVADGDQYDTSLWTLDGTVAQEICEVTGSVARMSYEELNGLVYISNPNWSTIYDLASDQVRDWGVALPDEPSVSIVDGDLPPGTYHLTYTKVIGDQIGGNGPFVKVIIQNDSRGIRLNNLSSEVLAWITHPNGGKLFLATIESDTITQQVPDMQPLPTLGIHPPPGFAHFKYAFGRIWGIVGNRIYYSEPNQYEWFRASNFLPFPEPIIMLAPVDNGMFVHSLKTSWFLQGTVPLEMFLHQVGYGAIPGTLTYTSVEGGGYEISKTLSQLPTAIWASAKGFVAGTNTGHLVYLTDNNIKFVGRSQGASITVERDGISRIIGSFWGNPIDYEDDDLTEIFTEHKL